MNTRHGAHTLHSGSQLPAAKINVIPPNKVQKASETVITAHIEIYHQGATSLHCNVFIYQIIQTSWWEFECPSEGGMINTGLNQRITRVIQQTSTGVILPSSHTDWTGRQLDEITHTNVVNHRGGMSFL